MTKASEVTVTREQAIAFNQAMDRCFLDGLDFVAALQRCLAEHVAARVPSVMPRKADEAITQSSSEDEIANDIVAGVFNEFRDAVLRGPG